MPYNILLVDDDKEFRQEFKDCFFDYGIVESSRGDEALEILKRPNEIDLVILDERMPGRRGTDILKEMRRLAPGLGVIILTGYSSKDVAVAALRGDADNYIEKPLDIKKTREIIEDLLVSTGKKGVHESDDITEKLNRVKRLADKNYDKKLTLCDASEMVCLSPKYLSRVFKQYVGMGFSEYKLKAKIKRAKEWLGQTGYSVDQIAYKLGYQNSESFIRIFKKMTGYTPTGYRSRSKKRKTAHRGRKKSAKN